jgi:DNA-binding NtrC family response regulator
MPALRDRRDDIPLLVDHFLEKISRAEASEIKQVAPEALEYLKGLDWPGNVRQLEHAVQKAVVLSGDRLILNASDFHTGKAAAVAAPVTTRVAEKPLLMVPKAGLDFDEAVSNFERSLLNQALAVSGGNKARAADLLKIKRTTLLAKLKSLEEGLESAERDHAPSLAEH